MRRTCVPCLESICHRLNSHRCWCLRGRRSKPSQNRSPESHGWSGRLIVSKWETWIINTELAVSRYRSDARVSWAACDELPSSSESRCGDAVSFSFEGSTLMRTRLFGRSMSSSISTSCRFVSASAIYMVSGGRKYWISLCNTAKFQWVRADLHCCCRNVPSQIAKGCSGPWCCGL